MLRRRIQNVRIHSREYDGIRPLPALGQRAGALTGEEQRVDLHVFAVVGAAVETREQRALAAGEKDVGIARVRRDIAALATAHAVGVCRAAPATAAPSAGCAGSTNRGAVLLRAADVIRDFVGDGDVIELRRGEL